MSQTPIASNGCGRPWDGATRRPRYRYRLIAGLVLLVCAAGATGWTAGGAIGDRPSDRDTVQLVEPAKHVRLGGRSIVAIVLCAGVIACATRPLHRGRKDWARLAIVEVLVSGALLAAVGLIYWIFWCPLSFLK